MYNHYDYNLIWNLSYLRQIKLHRNQYLTKEDIAYIYRYKSLYELSFLGILYTVPSKSSWTKWKYFLSNSKNILILNDLFQTIRIEIRPQETWGLIFDPYCSKTSFIFCWKRFVLHGKTWILRISRFFNFTNCPRTFGWHCMTAQCR